MSSQFSITIDTSEVRTFFKLLSTVGKRVFFFSAAKMFDAAKDAQELAVDMAPTYRNRLVASILQYGIRDSVGTRKAKRGITASISIGATVPYAKRRHDEEYFLGIGRQTKTMKKQAKGALKPFRVVRSDNKGGTMVKMGYELKGSQAKWMKTGGLVGDHYLTRALEAQISKIDDWSGLKEVLLSAVKQVLDEAAAQSLGKKK